MIRSASRWREGQDVGSVDGAPAVAHAAAGPRGRRAAPAARARLRLRARAAPRAALRRYRPARPARPAPGAPQAQRQHRRPAVRERRAAPQPLPAVPHVHLHLGPAAPVRHCVRRAARAIAPQGQPSARQAQLPQELPL